MRFSDKFMPRLFGLSAFGLFQFFLSHKILLNQMKPAKISYLLMNKCMVNQEFNQGCNGSHDNKPI